MKHLLMRVEGRFFNEDFVREVFYDALKEAGATVVRRFEHKFDPQGLTLVAILAESHAIISTWPEENYALVDYFSCAEEPGIDDFTDVWFESGFALKTMEVMER